MEVVLFVTDPVTEEQERFVCAAKYLCAQSKFFRDHPALNPSRARPSLSSIQLNIQCDIPTFSWLLKWMVAAEDPSQERPHLDVANVTSILISSHFLGMRSVTTVSVQFFSQHLGEIAQQPIDFNCVSEDLIRRIARQMDLSSLKSCIAACPDNVLVLRAASARNIDVNQIMQNSLKQEAYSKEASKQDSTVCEKGTLRNPSSKEMAKVAGRDPSKKDQKTGKEAWKKEYTDRNESDNVSQFCSTVDSKTSNPLPYGSSSASRRDKLGSRKPISTTNEDRATKSNNIFEDKPLHGDQWFNYEYHGSLPFSRRSIVGSGRVIRDVWRRSQVMESAEDSTLRRLERDARRDEDEFHRPSNLLQKLIEDTSVDIP